MLQWLHKVSLDSQHSRLPSLDLFMLDTHTFRLEKIPCPKKCTLERVYGKANASVEIDATSAMLYALKTWKETKSPTIHSIQL